MKNQNEKPAFACGDIQLLESIGYVHKRVLIAVGKHPDFPKIEPRVHYDLVVAEVRKYNVNAGFRLAEVPTFEHELEVLTEIQTLPAEDYIEKLVNKGTVSLLGGRVLAEILEILDSNSKPRLKVNAFQELFGYVRIMETLEAKEKYALLVGLKIAVSSFEFFNGEMNEKNSPYRKAIDQYNFERKRINWADIIGGVVNCIGCGVGGGGAAGCIGCAEISSALGSSWFGGAKI